MKRIFAATILFATLMFSARAQEESGKKKGAVHPPAAAVAAFKKSFPAAAKVSWEREGALYEVNFRQDSREMSALYDEKGEWKETETGIALHELPASVTAYVKMHYPNARIREAARIQKADRVINYEAEVNGKDLIFDANGQFLRETED